MNINEIEAGPELVRQVRAGFILQKTTLTEWCRDKGVKRQNAMSCLVGLWDGPKGKQLRSQIVISAGLADQADKTG